MAFNLITTCVKNVLDQTKPILMKGTRGHFEARCIHKASIRIDLS